MRRFAIALLLASAAATPALADPDHSWSHSSRGDAQESRGDHHQSNPNSGGDRSFGGGHHDSAPSGGQPAPDRVQWGGRGGGGDAGHQDNGVNRGGGQQGFVESGMVNPGRHDDRGARVGWQGRVIENQTGDTGQRDGGENGGGRHQRVIDSRMNDGRQAGGGESGFWERRTRQPGAVETRDRESGALVQPDRPLPRVLRTRTPIISSVPREGTQPPLRNDLGRRTASVQWNTNWRHDRRYDWWNWRRRHHSFFHLGIYFDPFGWGYQPFDIGWRLWPSYYSSNYWINDPWQYRLPYAPPGYRWIRYYDDALLVDTWTGEVVDVIRDFFW